ncbi:unnamed protein product [Urochloa decumbens]|uniref:Fe2OG dioxygenase domain-containing protein n=1 Tax=Urochloa decumbens TaxID=240449 RepID=A0ABC9DU96_9POAL
MADYSWRLPTIVQELAATVQEPPSRYLLPEQNRPGGLLACVEMPEVIPTIDLRRLSANNDVDEADHPESFRDLLHEYSLSCKKVKVAILRAMAKLLKLDEHSLINQFGDKASTYARFNYYPPCPRPDLVLGIRPHCDVGVLTLLLMDKDVGGLQVLRDGTWYSVPPVRDQGLLVNIGASLEIMTNGVFRGPMHRVVTNSEKERISLAIFYAVDSEKDIEPMADLLGENQPARYRKIKGKDFVPGQYEYFSRREGVVDSLKI